MPEAAGRWKLVIHGGCGVIEREMLSAEQEASARAGLSAALAAGSAILSAGGSALDAVVEAARASRLLRTGGGERESRVLRPGRAVCASRVSRGRGVARGVSPVLRDRGPALAEPRTPVGDVPRQVMCRSVPFAAPSCT